MYDKRHQNDDRGSLSTCSRANLIAIIIYNIILYAIISIVLSRANTLQFLTLIEITRSRKVSLLMRGKPLVSLAGGRHFRAGNSYSRHYREPYKSRQGFACETPFKRREIITYQVSVIFARDAIV